MNEVAAKKIKAILNGKKASSVKDHSGVSQKPSKGNAICMLKRGTRGKGKIQTIFYVGL